MRDDVPRRFRRKTTDGKHPTGRDAEYTYGCYFPSTDLVVGEMGGRGTGVPSGVEWLDNPSELMLKILESRNKDKENS